MPDQVELHFLSHRNSAFFSTHWLKNRLPLEPEWTECRIEAEEFAEELMRLWTRQKNRVARYRSEHALEEAFIQPIFDLLGWKLKYQPQLQGRTPDYAPGATGSASASHAPNPPLTSNPPSHPDSTLQPPRPQAVNQRQIRQRPPRRLTGVPQSEGPVAI